MRTYVKAKRGICAMCGIANSAANAWQIHEQSGRYYERWADGVIKYGRGLAARRRQEVAAARAARRAALTPYPWVTRP